MKTLDDTPDQRTGTGHGLSGTGWTIIGTTAADNIVELLARLPKLRKDARANVEIVLHELIADKNATIPQICARTGMALRTINNALSTLREAKIIQSRNDKQMPYRITGQKGEAIKSPEAINEAIYEAIKSRPGINKPEIVLRVGKSKDTVERALAALIAAGKVEHRGSKKTGGYYLVGEAR